MTKFVQIKKFIVTQPHLDIVNKYSNDHRPRSFEEVWKRLEKTFNLSREQSIQVTDTWLKLLAATELTF